MGHNDLCILFTLNHKAMTIRSQELRLNNLVIVNHKTDLISTVIGIQPEMISVEFERQPDLVSGLHVSPNNLNGIPLTEQWLIDFGFQSDPYFDRYEYYGIQVDCDKTKGETQLWIDDASYIKHVHQLQNLYFALTGHELTLNK